MEIELTWELAVRSFTWSLLWVITVDVASWLRREWRAPLVVRAILYVLLIVATDTLIAMVRP